MQNAKCPTCGHETTPGAACQGCGHAAVNGVVNRNGVKSPPPPELANRAFTPTPPEILEQMRREFDEAEYLAAVRELELTGGVQIDDLIEEFERRVNGRA